MQTHSITLGMNISDSGKVTNQMWLQFLETEVVTRLDYATITDAIGIYKGTVENSKIISVTVDERTTRSTQIRLDHTRLRIGLDQADHIRLH